MSKHGNCLSAFLVSKFQYLKGIIIFYPPRRKKIVLNLLLFHQVSYSCITWLSEMEGIVVPKKFC